MKAPFVLLAVAVLAIGLGTWIRGKARPAPQYQATAMDHGAMAGPVGDSGATPDLSEIAAGAPSEYAAGRAVFTEHCSVCHGAAGGGTQQGPALVHRIYEPSHHADMAFQLAVRIGVRAHHWRFGDMLPVPGVTDEQIAAVTAYVRWLQRQVGIT